MAGQSDQEKAAKEQLKEQKAFRSSITSGDFGINNPFGTYVSPFGYDDINANLENIFGKQKDLIIGESNNAVAEGQSDAVNSLTSRGIGGSAIDDVTAKVGAAINKDKTNALTRLGIGKAGAMADLMEYINSLDLGIKKAGADVESQNQGNKLSALSGSFGLSGNLLQGLDNTTWLDDVFAGIKMGSKAAADIGMIPGI